MKTKSREAAAAATNPLCLSHSGARGGRRSARLCSLRLNSRFMSAEEAAPNGATTNAPALEPVIDSVRSSMTDTVSEKLSAVEDTIQRKLDIDSVRSDMTDTVSEKLSAVEDTIQRKLDIDSVRSDMTDTVSEKLSAVEDTIQRKLDIDSVRSDMTDTVSEKLSAVEDTIQRKLDIDSVRSDMTDTVSEKLSAVEDTIQRKLDIDSVRSDMTDMVSEKLSAVEDKILRKLCGVGEKRANKVKVAFILLTGLVALVEAGLITATTEPSVYIDMELLDEGFKWSNLLPSSCISDKLPPPPAGETASPKPPGLPPPQDSASDQAIAALTSKALTSNQSLIDLWYSDTIESQCKYDPLFSGEATVDNCGPQPECIRGLSVFFTMTLFLSAVCYTGARIALHYLTMRDSQLCDCCPGCIRTGLRICLKMGAPVALNSLMIVNTKMAWQEGGKNGVPSHVYGYRLGFSTLELFFVVVNVLFMMVFVLVGSMLVVAPTCCAGMIKICCKACGGGANAMRNAVKRVKQWARGYLVLMLYILSFWGIVTTIVAAALEYEDWASTLKYEDWVSPSIAIQSFPLIDIAMTLIMFPPNLAVQLDSELPRVWAVGALRICKVISVCIALFLEYFHLFLKWKYSGPPCKCCTKCFPCCGQGDTPQQGKGLNEIKVEVEGAITDAAAEAEQTATEIKVEVEGAITDAAAEAKQTATEIKVEVEGAISDAAAEAKQTATEIKVEVEGAITDAAAEAKQTATEIKVEVEGAITDAAAEAKQTATELAEINVQDRVVEETEKLIPQLEENASADLQALKDAAPTSSRDWLQRAKDWAWDMSDRASARADSEEQKASERLSGTSAPSKRLSI
ncbi:hypothetical protein EMIHUDRAFT_233657 [Emiliania huxleyi CCMP1516]|uniref:Uncharacterized protein n=2 Tax=Emiliania huxleyi TaxID=2903 RepID=A0A0D3K1V3_EMIH1|nr:hypothetical protein EMIHUDRAFT_233657 [Emiliania huxleyi CCMP1516]EOD29738.1 hypothetical protein EMIHUDRAFT_233657 [Emiliania huxleyi CCMP1516]|eukprot:XP_005782167.1 hypothetical protein EMIHUDRAFT_233657 [Emiliania huxleyi CCMP1516]